MVFYRSKNEVILTQGFWARKQRTKRTTGAHWFFLEIVWFMWFPLPKSWGWTDGCLWNTLSRPQNMETFEALNCLILCKDGWEMVSSPCGCQRLPGFKVGELVSDAFAQQPYCILQATKINYSTCDVEDLEFDRGVSMPSWALPAFLISQKKAHVDTQTSRCPRIPSWFPYSWAIFELGCRAGSFRPWWSRPATRVDPKAKWVLDCYRIIYRLYQIIHVDPLQDSTAAADHKDGFP